MESKQFTFNEILEKIEQWIDTDVIDPDDIPSIELYMDQVTTFMDKELAGTKRNPDDKILTKTMINNYSKNNLLPPSDKKKYSKDHIILLIYIYYMKNFLSINDIQTLLKPMTDNYFETSEKQDTVSKPTLSMSDIYADIIKIENEYRVKLKENIDEVCEIAVREFSEESEYLKTFAMVAMLSYDIYAKKQLIERLIDSIAPEVPDKAAIKEAAKNKSLEEKARKEKAHKEKAALKEAKENKKQLEKQAKDNTK